MTTRSEAIAAGTPNLKLRFVYDWRGRRIEKETQKLDAAGTLLLSSDKRRFVYDGWNLIADYRAKTAAASGWELLRNYVWGTDRSGTLQGAGGIGGLVLVRQHVAERTAQPGSYVPAYDGNGNVIALYDRATGQSAAEYECGPFGETLRATGAMAEANPTRWSTKYEDWGAELCYYGHRYYSSKSGEWLSRDPLGGAFIAASRFRTAGEVAAWGTAVTRTFDGYFRLRDIWSGSPNW